MVGWFPGTTTDMALTVAEFITSGKALRIRKPAGTRTIISIRAIKPNADSELAHVVRCRTDLFTLLDSGRLRSIDERKLAHRLIFCL